MEFRLKEFTIKGFKLDYEDSENKIVDGIDQIDIFARINSEWTIIKNVKGYRDTVVLITKDGEEFKIDKHEPKNKAILQGIGDITQEFKKHFAK